MSKKTAIIGMSALFPQARNLQQFWQNILEKRYCITEKKEWEKHHFDPSRQQKNKIYNLKGGFLDDLKTFSPIDFGVVPKSIDGADPGHFLSLHMANEAIKDSGYHNCLPRRTGVIIGASFSSHRGMGSLMQHGLFVKQMLQNVTVLFPGLSTEQLAQIEKKITTHLPQLTPDSVPGSVHNLYAGRIANHFGLEGPNYVVDAACASSAIAIKNAIYELNDQQCEVMVVGGVSATIDFMFSLLFSLIGALSPDEMRPFDARANGILLGEGLGFIVLKPYEKAVADNDRIYAVIRGVGCSSDGKSKGLFVPNVQGEKRAILQAYEPTQVSPRSVSLIEAHGTGTALGDPTEITALTEVYGKRTTFSPSCAIGSIKSMIAHPLAAAGIAGVIKMALSLYHKILPASICGQVNPKLQLDTTPFYVNTTSKMWIHPQQQPRRAGVNIFGFGGINAHVFLEENTPEDPEDPLHANRKCEIFVFSEDSKSKLIAILQKYLHDDRFLQLSLDLVSKKVRKHRLAIVASNTEELHQKLSLAIDKLKSTKCLWQTVDGVFYNSQKIKGKTAFVFPGQTSGSANMFGELGLHFPVVRKWFDFLSSLDGGALLSQVIFPCENSMNHQQKKVQHQLLNDSRTKIQSVFGASLAMWQILKSLCITCDGVIGYSSGQYAALVAAGACDIHYHQKTGIDFLNDVPLTTCSTEGKFLIVTAHANDDGVQKVLLCYQDQMCLAMDNCTNQIVLFVQQQIIEDVKKTLDKESLPYLVLDISAPIHTKWYQFQHNYPRVKEYNTPLYSCCSGDLVANEPQKILETMIKEWSTTVRFRETIENMYRDGYRTFIEVGPGNYAASFIRNTLAQKTDVQVVATNSPHQSDLWQLLNTLAKLYTTGIPIDFTSLFRRQWENSKTNGVVLDNSLPFVELSEADQLREWNTPQNKGVCETKKHHDIFDEKWPLLEKIVHKSKTRYVFSRLFSPDVDTFLYDHTFSGRASVYCEIKNLPVFPLAVALEMIVEASVYYVGGGFSVAELVNVYAKKWMFFESQKTIYVQVEQVSQQETSVVVHARIFEGSLDHLRVEADVVLKETLEKKSYCFTEQKFCTTGNIYIDESQPCFRIPGIPQGKSFHRINSLASVTTQHVNAKLKKRQDCFFHKNCDHWQLDITALDSCFSSGVLWAMHCGFENLFFPIKVDKISFFDIAAQHDLQCQTQYRPSPEMKCGFFDENGIQLYQKDIANLHHSSSYFRINLLPMHSTLKYHSKVVSATEVYAEIEGALYFAGTPLPLYRFFCYPHLVTLSETVSKNCCRISLSFIDYICHTLSDFDRKRFLHLILAPQEFDDRDELHCAKLILAKDIIRVWGKAKFLLHLSPRDIDTHTNHQQLWGYCRYLPQFLFRISFEQKQKHLYAYIEIKSRGK
ncbi:type I polyketide synthase [Candidatus Uabimicrobium amorphum]|uniref:Type I polyketide synthase n=1 Tax=Uabimicrobium amorphum TaxID=2596890 RepID=A0A5S9F7G2_UABAM|nr:beta-ketoacyl synthase N-terminal-like domain-containing protein [Candidatus Uabimicrobium amorphum]BBM88321.1 type I polyketide synthase [Candidatus Uabimicrobium amorphum]